MRIAFHGLPTDQVEATKAAGRDVYGGALETQISEGAGTPCRHCLETVPKGATFHILAWRPFSAPRAYAETGPIFLCQSDCAAAEPSDRLPAMLGNETYCLRPYNDAERIRYGHERLVSRDRIVAEAGEMLADLVTAFVDVRNPHTGCFQCRVLRA